MFSGRGEKPQRCRRDTNQGTTVQWVFVCVIFVDVFADGVLPHVVKGKQSVNRGHV